MKEIILIILAILLGYILPLILGYRVIRIAHSKNGRWSILNPGIGDFLIMILPIFNLFLASTSPYLKNERNNNWSKFFKINKN